MSRYSNVRFDAIIVLGSKPDTASWMFPTHVYKSLELAAALLKHKAAPIVAVAGAWALEFDHRNIRQPFLECDRLAQYLEEQGVASNMILKERESKDTMANLYNLKKMILEPRSMRHILLIAADFRLPRIQFLCQKIFGNGYWVEFRAVPSEPGEPYPNEANTFAKQKAFLENMRPGDDAFLKGKFYTDPYFQALFRKSAK